MLTSLNGSFLESGALTELEPLGAGGETLLGSAAELRDAIARRLGPGVAACFAVPQQSANGDTLDWYAPETGAVTPWNSLTDEQRNAALKQIEGLRRKVIDLSRELVREDRRDLQTFGRLLEHAATIPDDSHIFLVGDRPVLAFWGFRRRGQAQTPPALPVPSRQRRRWWPVALPGAAVAVAVAGFFWYQLTRYPEPAPAPPPPPPETPEGEVLVLPPKGTEPVSTQFLTGRWHATGEELVDSDSKRPLRLVYELNQGIGEVVITEQGGTDCRAPVDAAFDGEILTLTPREAIRCPSRAPFYGVTVTCRPSTDRRALCTGSFPNGKHFRVELRRQQ